MEQHQIEHDQDSRACSTTDASLPAPAWDAQRAPRGACDHSRSQEPIVRGQAGRGAHCHSTESQGLLDHGRQSSWLRLGTRKGHHEGLACTAGLQEPIVRGGASGGLYLCKLLADVRGCVARSPRYGGRRHAVCNVSPASLRRRLGRQHLRDASFDAHLHV